MATKPWLRQLLLICFLNALCSATCCYNHKWMCFGTGINCTPNCSDGVSMCDTDTQVCINDNWGGCLDVVFTTVTVIGEKAKVTKYDYTTTATSINATQTLWATQTVTTTRETITVTGQAPATSSEAVQSVITSANGAPFLIKRGGINIRPTSTITSTITDPSFCRSPPSTVIKQLVDACTTTISTASISLVTTSVTQTTTLVMNATATMTAEPAHTATKEGESAVMAPGHGLLSVMLGVVGAFFLA